MACGKLTFLIIFVTCCAFFSVNGHKKELIILNEDNWTSMLEDEWMVEFYAPWCPACKGLQPVWKEFATWSEDLGINVAQVDVTTSPGLSGRFMVTALPTIFHVLNGEFRQYKGTRDKDSFFSFIEEKKWKSVEPVPTWKSPNSIQMSVVSFFFKLSQILRGIHNHLMEEFGLPTWGSYLIFAVATIILGALLGLILVCIIDFIYPPRPTMTKVSVDDAKRKKRDIGVGDDNELADEDIKGDLLDDTSISDNEKHSGAASISDDEKNSGSDEECDSAEENPKTPKEYSNPNSPKIKKRKPRKAD